MSTCLPPRPVFVAGLLLLAAVTGCRSTASTSTGPSPVKCQVTLAPILPVAADGGTSKTTVSTTAECAWSGSADVPWILLEPSSGQGAADITVQVRANPTAAQRQGEITLNGAKIAVSQAAAPCTFDIAPRSQAVPQSGGTGSVAVTALAGCAWTASSGASWLSVTAGATGSGPGTVRFAAESNPAGARVGTLTVAGQAFTVTQQALNPGCAYTVQPTAADIEAEGGTTTVAVDAGEACSWTAASDAAWLSIAGEPTGAGKGSVTVVVAPNPSTARSGILTIANQTFTVNQAAGCAASISPTSLAIPAAGGAAAVTVSMNAACAWVTTSGASWVTVRGGATGVGNGQVLLDVAANSGAARTGTVSVAGRVLTVTQSGACPLAVAPLSYAAPVAGGAGPAVAVTGPAGCTWTATSSVSWLTVTAGATGSGNGTVAFTVAANPGAARTGTLAIAGSVVTITQAGSCAATVTPPNQSIAAAGGAATPLTVGVADGCAWTATTTAPWITITKGASGSGNGTVEFAVAAHAGPARSATIAVAGQIHTVNQASGCSIAIAPTSFNATALPGPGTPIAVTAADGCAWTASTSSSWITITLGSTGAGNGSVVYLLDANLSAARVGSILVADKTFTVNQAGLCSYSLKPTNHNFNNGNARTAPSIAVDTIAGCPWTATSNASWITVLQGASGTGPGQVVYSVTANTTGSERVGTLTIAGLTFTVAQGR